MRPPWWALASAVVAPVAMIGGWTLAAARQQSFDPVAETISALAAAPSVDTWIMTTGLAVTGACHVVTSLGLRGLPAAGRALLALGGVATAAVAALPVDLYPHAHGVAAGTGFAALALWPAASAARRPASGRGIGVGPGLGTSAVLVVLLGAFVLELAQGGPGGGAALGLTERLVAGAESLAPLAVAVWLRARSRQTSRTGPG
ncbi:DUF998 domain-containing protein [Cellulomonas sp. PhB143]|uniref:DUF998 domain-containing protein n=1 Tax=Cellulomonas sp. PhB143 TaxID=2485186 RepID=UPI000F488357|nr:DUF998 domain-containing protein [Cellulomonas sp. PhB143]ROS76510.1 putative membrane protein [Cellulomonas sp. PhB143]